MVTTASPRSVVRIASRGSELALWQARHVRDVILRAVPGVSVEIEVVKTVGDRVLDVPLSRIGDRGLFTKEVDAAVTSGRADLAVHSLKDVPTQLTEGLALAAITEREDPRDVVIQRAGSDHTLETLPAGSRVGTSSLRRRSQLGALRPDVDVVDLRGNLNTRLARLDAGDYDAILLAAAGVLRLGWKARISEWLSPDRWLPAVGQGALALVTRADDRETQERLRIAHHAETADSVHAERSLLHALEGGCQVPIGALARVEDGELVLEGLVASLDGATVIRGSVRGPRGAARELGKRLAAQLHERGGGAILAEIRSEAPGPPVPPP